MDESRGRDRRIELLGLAILLVIAFATRFLYLPTRGMWDADQGHDLLVLRAFVRDGIVPLLGPPTSIGDLHHGALYYWLLAPAAAISNADPAWVTALIALGGVAAVAVVWWLAGSIGGRVAGVVAAGAMTISASAIEESTFVWNPNIVGLASAVALAGAWQAWRTGSGRWWLLAAAGQAVTMQGHVLGAILLPPLVALYLADLRRRDPAGRRKLAAAGLGAVAVIVVAYLPLLVHELANGFPETRAALDVLTGRAGSGESGPSAPLAIVVIALRALSWPLAGLLTNAPAVALTAAVAVVAALAWRAVAGGPSERIAARWFAATIAWSVLALAVIAPSLATVVPGLPNDHYHAFLDPIVFVATGLGAAALWRFGPPVRSLPIAASAAILAWNVSIWPPPVAADGGWPAAELAAARIAEAAAGDPITLLGIPDFKPTDAVGYPLTRLGEELASDGPILVVACDRLFEDVVGAACGGPAEDAIAGSGSLIDRFDLSPRTSISVYRR